MALLDFSALIRDRTQHFVGREWVFEAVAAWLADPAAPRVFLLSGDPGTGKSAVAARLVQISAGEVDTGGHPGLLGFLTHHHFCQATSESTLVPLRFVEGLSERLANRYPAFRTELQRRASHQIAINASVSAGTAMPGATLIGAKTDITIEIRGTDARSLFDEVVRRPLQAWQEACPGESVVILVDSLDEALLFRDENNIAQLLKLAADFPPSVRFLLTCRTQSDRVFEILGQKPTRDLVLNAPRPREELRQYVAARLAGIPEPPRGTLAARVADASGENFLVAYHVLNDLLGRASRLDEQDALDLPSTLEEVYRKFLDRELLASRPRWNDVYRPMLGAIAVASGAGLTSDQLTGITGLADDTAGDVLRVCGQYLAGGDGPDSPYRIYHQSFRDFLLEERSTYSVYPAERHAAVARYLQDRHGGNWSKCQDEYALRYTPVHWSAAAAGSENQREVRTQELIRLAGHPKYQRQFERRIGDLPQLHRHLESALGTAALNDGEEMLPWLLRAVAALKAFRAEYLEGESVVALAEAGKLGLAESRLSLFEHLGTDWQSAAQLMLAWLSSDRNPADARQTRDRLAGADEPPLSLLWRRLDAALAGQTQVTVMAPPPITLEEGTQLVRRMSGQDFDREMLGAINPSLIAPVGGASRKLTEHGYAATTDAPLLVSLAAASPQEGTALVDEYIDGHAGYNYVEYRNQSLWHVLHAVLRDHPDQAWVRQRLGRILVGALTGGGVDFGEMLPFTAAVLLARARSGDARPALDGVRDQALTAAALLQNRRGANDSWGSHKRRLAALLELYALVVGDPAAAEQLLDRIGRSVVGEPTSSPELPDGFAGYQSPATLRIADALRATGLDTPARIDGTMLSALKVANNVQDHHFAARITARCHAMREWHQQPLAGPALAGAVAALASTPGAVRFSAAHRVGEAYALRSPERGMLSVQEATQASTLEALVEVFQRPAVDFRRLNPDHGLDQVIPPGTWIRIPDPGLRPLLAVHLAARVMADPALEDERSTLIRSLVPAASGNPTALDSLLSYLLIAADLNDDELLAEIAEAAGPATLTDAAVPTSQIGPDGPLPT